MIFVVAAIVITEPEVTFIESVLLPVVPVIVIEEAFLDMFSGLSGFVVSVSVMLTPPTVSPYTAPVMLIV